MCRPSAGVRAMCFRNRDCFLISRFGRTCFTAPARTAGNWTEVTGFLGIAHLLDRWPNTLSGGEARRVAIGRALLSNPRFLLLDEPLSSLDRARREEVMRAIEHVRDVRRLPILMVTHDIEEAERIGTRIVSI